MEELEEDDDDPVDELDELELDEDEELELEDDEDEDEDADDDEDVDEDELEPELEELPVLDDELPMGVGVPGVSSPQPTRRVPAAIDAAPESSSRKCRRSVTSGFVSGAGIFSVTV